MEGRGMVPEKGKEVLGRLQTQRDVPTVRVIVSRHFLILLLRGESTAGTDYGVFHIARWKAVIHDLRVSIRAREPSSRAEGLFAERANTPR
jgi:hypothetical protein